jgi:hypothetical protein
MTSIIITKGQAIYASPHGGPQSDFEDRDDDGHSCCHFRWPGRVIK